LTRRYCLPTFVGSWGRDNDQQFARLLIDAIENVDMIDSGSAVVELSSLGTPIRLRLSLHSMVDLAAMSRKTCSLILA
jgi:hypothetical protein